MHKTARVFAVASLLCSLYTINEQAFAVHTDILIPVLEMEPKSPVGGQVVTLTTVLTNTGHLDLSDVQVSFNLDGVWIIDDMSVNVPARKSVRVSFTAVMPVSAGEHQLKACPERESLGDDGDQCETIKFVAIDESTIVVAIVSPREEEILSGKTTIKVATFGQDTEKVELYIQNELVATEFKVPFDFTLDTTKYENGKYRLYAIAYYDSGIARTSSVKKYVIDNIGSAVVTVIPGLVTETQSNVGQSVIIESDITNKQTLKIAATFIVLVKNSNGYTEFLSWHEEAIPSGETFPMSRTWIPDTRGPYSIETFLWDTIESPVPLTDVMKAKIFVH